MALPEVIDGTAWLAARRELLAREEELTRRRDALGSHLVASPQPFEMPGRADAAHAAVPDFSTRPAEASCVARPPT